MINLAKSSVPLQGIRLHQALIMISGTNLEMISNRTPKVCPEAFPQIVVAENARHALTTTDTNSASRIDICSSRPFLVYVVLAAVTTFFSRVLTSKHTNELLSGQRNDNSLHDVVAKESFTSLQHCCINYVRNAVSSTYTYIML